MDRRTLLKALVGLIVTPKVVAVKEIVSKIAERRKENRLKSVYMDWGGCGYYVVIDSNHTVVDGHHRLKVLTGN